MPEQPLSVLQPGPGLALVWPLYTAAVGLRGQGQLVRVRVEGAAYYVASEIAIVSSVPVFQVMYRVRVRVRVNRTREYLGAMGIDGYITRTGCIWVR